jgi:hypothetical protein
MKTKLQIFKESTVYVLVLGFLGTVLYLILGSLFGDEIWLGFGLSSFVSYIGTCIFMSYLFEKEKPLWLGSLQYIVIGIFAALLTILLVVIGIPFIFDILINQTYEYWKNQFGSSGLLDSLILIIPLFFISVVFAVFALIGYISVSFFIGNWFFSFLLQWAFNKYNIKSSETKSDTISSTRNESDR